MVRTAASHARVRGSVPGLGGLKETKMFLPHPRVKLSIVGSSRDREVACSASDRQGSKLESCVWRTVSSHSSHHPQEVLLAQFSLYVHKGGLKPDSFHLLDHLYYLFQVYVLQKYHLSPQGPLLPTSQSATSGVADLAEEDDICCPTILAYLINPLKPEFTFVIYIHYKPRIAITILDLSWMKMTRSG